MRGAKRPGRGITISARTRSADGYVAFLRREVRRAVGLIGSQIAELSIALVSDAEMSRLHRRFLGEDGPTDVLTFELDSDARGDVTSGEIVICVPHARRVAAERGLRLRDELLLYAIHGLLHLSGHEDRTQRGFHRMHRIEDRILTELGIGPVFSPPPRRSTASTKGRGRRR